ncbi:hypothetical protein G6M70_05990 [Agrobacterium tumefaciens]|uniref:hypothetical protein n=1 Tax=Agrobacterium tumefaciens TaxID=358 RepID=UPI001571FD22|nr:hypothetical protein [Agrobacterium tumefaciens]NSZ00619.1 hypothetical protein [Agrobacterium tumefaciens]NSZ38113.1 hypothetical protein [Agrobacterium tumefaciens]NTB25640.1 hypothetical protein [Agrobacterium tumefaciens]NTB27017.1 hypothetical protein [Agrobacterium tumefaciens]NTB32357.1 hypothetical protein [Agrobacterium tumefaciens]
MAISNAEAQKRWRLRQKEKREMSRKKAEASHWYAKADFQSFLENHPDADEFNLPLDLMNITPPVFVDGEPATTTGLHLDSENEDDAPYFKAMGRADVFVGLFIESAVALAKLVNEFKLKEIDDRIKEIEAAKFADQAEWKEALNDIVRLNRMRDQLSKQVRVVLPQWKVTGD